MLHVVMLLAQSLDSRRKFIIKNMLKLSFPFLKVKKNPQLTASMSMFSTLKCNG